MNLVLEDKKVKRKKSKPRFISVQPDDLEQFMKDVGEYKQILRSIGMYDLCQNWKQTRGQQRKEESDVKKKAKLLRNKEKESMGLVWYDMKEKQKSQEAYLQQLQGEEDEDEELETNQQILDIQEYNRAYYNQNEDSEKNLEKSLFAEGKAKKDKLNTSTQEKQFIAAGNERSFEKGSENNTSLVEKSYIERSPNNNEADGLENIFSDQHDSRYEQEKQPKKGKKKISKKKVSLINKSLRDKQQFRSQEHSEVDNIEELIADQDMSMLEKLPANGNLERSLLGRLDKSNMSASENQQDEDESQFRETENEQKQVSEEYDEKNEAGEEESGQDKGDQMSVNSDQIDSKHSNKQKNKKKKKEKKKKKLNTNDSTQNQEPQQESNDEDKSISQAKAIKKKIKKKKKKQTSQMS